jgi:hypothetical protein
MFLSHGSDIAHQHADNKTPLAASWNSLVEAYTTAKAPQPILTALKPMKECYVKVRQFMLSLSCLHALIMMLFLSFSFRHGLHSSFSAKAQRHWMPSDALIEVSF